MEEKLKTITLSNPLLSHFKADFESIPFDKIKSKHFIPAIKKGININEKQNIESPKEKVKAPNSRPNTAPSSKKTPHRTFSNSSKKPGKTDWDDSATVSYTHLTLPTSDLV
mgnify:CR=1 FL=1